MKKTKAIILLGAFILGLAATACQTKHSCPAYGNARKGLSTHRSI